MKRLTAARALESFGVVAVAALVLLSPTQARACGVSAAGVASCSLAEHDEAERPKWAVGVSGIYTSTSLRFSGSIHADQIRYATLSAIAYMPTPKLVLQAGIGVAFGGSLTLPDGKYEFSPGPTGSLAADYLVFDDGRFFVLLTSLLSFSAARTHLGDARSIAYEAFDLRLGGEFGVDIAKVFRPYAALRAFGGPVYWHYHGDAVTGTDTHHYQVGAGLGVRIARSVNLFVEGIPLGERAVSGGAAVAF